MDRDLLQRFIFENIPVRGEFVCLEKSYQIIISQHAYPPPICHLIGEALCVVSLLSAIIKFKGRVTLQFRGQGQLKLLLAESDNNFNIRSLIKWTGELNESDLSQTLQQGVLAIMLDVDNKKNGYQGIVSWEGNSLAASIEGYFQKSEQLATKIWLKVTDQLACGLLLQITPGAEKEHASIERAVADTEWERIVKATNLADKNQLFLLDFNTLLNVLYPHDEIRIFPAKSVQFKCTCSLKKSEEALYLLGEEEANSELKNRNSIAVTCEFCNREYLFDRVDVAKIFSDRADRNTKPIH